MRPSAHLCCRRTARDSWAPPPPTPTATTHTTVPSLAATLRAKLHLLPSTLPAATCTRSCGCRKQMSRHGAAGAAPAGLGGLHSLSGRLLAKHSKQHTVAPTVLPRVPTLPTCAGAPALCAVLDRLPRGAEQGPAGQAAGAQRIWKVAGAGRGCQPQQLLLTGW